MPQSKDAKWYLWHWENISKVDICLWWQNSQLKIKENKLKIGPQWLTVRIWFNKNFRKKHFGCLNAVKPRPLSVKIKFYGRTQGTFPRKIGALLYLRDSFQCISIWQYLSFLSFNVFSVSHKERHFVPEYKFQPFFLSFFLFLRFPFLHDWKCNRFLAFLGEV